MRWLVGGIMCFLAAAMIAAPAAAQGLNEPGFGASEQTPRGQAFVLPAGLELAGPIVGADDDGNCPRPSSEPVGTGLLVRVCVPVRNKTEGGVEVVFPAGLVIVSASEGFQNGLLVERELIVIPPYTRGPGTLRDEGRVIYIPLHLYCINEPRDPSIPGAVYTLGPVTRPGGLGDIQTLIQDKAIKDDGLAVEVVQEALYDLIADGHVNEYSREALLNLPDA